MPVCGSLANRTIPVIGVDFCDLSQHGSVVARLLKTCDGVLQYFDGVCDRDYPQYRNQDRLGLALLDFVRKYSRFDPILSHGTMCKGVVNVDKTQELLKSILHQLELLNARQERMEKRLENIEKQLQNVESDIIVIRDKLFQ